MGGHGRTDSHLLWNMSLSRGIYEGLLISLHFRKSGVADGERVEFRFLLGLLGVGSDSGYFDLSLGFDLVRGHVRTSTCLQICILLVRSTCIWFVGFGIQLLSGRALSKSQSCCGSNWFVVSTVRVVRGWLDEVASWEGMSGVASLGGGSLSIH